jgi:hypothetical protein
MRDDLRNRLLGLKRSELAAVMAGRNQPQPLAALLFRSVGPHMVCVRQHDEDRTACMQGARYHLLQYHNICVVLQPLEVCVCVWEGGA